MITFNCKGIYFFYNLKEKSDNMKKAIIPALLITTAVILGSCAQEPNEPSTCVESKSDISYVSEIYSNSLYHTQIKAHDGRILENFETIKEPEIIKVSDSITAVSISFGTGLSTKKTYVYDLESGEKEEYTAALTIFNDNIVYCDSTSITIKKIFGSKEKTVSEFDYPVSKINEIPFFDAQTDIENGKLTVSYYSGSSFEKKSQTIDISEFI